MMESEESSDVADDQHKSEQISAFLVQVLKDNQVLLEKAQVANSKTIKRQAIEIIRDKYETKFGEKINTQQILKKISNMKWRTKYKVNLNKSGYRNYVLKDWEKELLELLELENQLKDNHQINNTNNNKIQQQQQSQSQLPGTHTFGGLTNNKSPDCKNNSLILQSPITTTTIGCGEIFYSSTPLIEQQQQQQQTAVYAMEPPPTKKSKTSNTRIGDSILSKYETDETLQLNDGQLQRLVLLKQNLVLNKKLKMMQIITTTTTTQQPIATAAAMQSVTNHHHQHHHHPTNAAAIVVVSGVGGGGGGVGGGQQQQQHNMHQQQQHQQIQHQLQSQQQQIIVAPPSSQQQQQQQQIREILNGDVAMEIKSRNLSFDEF